MNARTLWIAALSGLVVIAALFFMLRGEDGRDAADGTRTEDVRVADSVDAVAERPGDAPPLPDDGTPGDEAPSSPDAPVSSDGAAPSTPPVTGGGGAAGADADGSDVAAGSPGSTTQDPTAEILRATARRYEGVRSLQADFEQQLTNTLLSRTTHSAGTLYQRQPDRFLMRFSDPDGDLIVSDGDFFWLYYPSVDPNQVIRSARGAGGLDLRSQFVGDPVSRFEATSHGRETVGGRATHVLTLTPREPVGYRRLKAWIDVEDHLVRRFELTEDNGNIRRFDLTDLRVNPTLPDELFRFEPPAGAVVVTR